MAKITPIHPGEHLAEFIDEFEITAYRVAKDVGVSPPRINDIVLQKRGITADTAIRIARYFGTSAQYWMNLQAKYDLEVAQDHVNVKNIKPIAA